jgi:tRNA(Ile)-lysidine synthase
VHEAAAELLAPLGASAWADPHNADRSFARVRVRTLLDGLVADLGPGVVLGLARSADLLRDDADALDRIAADTFAQVVVVHPNRSEAICDDLVLLSAAVRTRVIRLAALSAGCPGDALGVDHVRRIDALVTDWHGQGPVALPGGVMAGRAYGRLSCIRADVP